LGKSILTPTIDELRLISQIYNVSYDYLLVLSLETPRKVGAHKQKSFFKYGYYISLALISGLFITLGVSINPLSVYALTYFMIVSTIIFISVRYNKYFILLIVFYLYPLLDQTLLIHFTNKYFDKLKNRSMILIQNLLAYTAYVFLILALVYLTTKFLKQEVKVMHHVYLLGLIVYLKVLTVLEKMIKIVVFIQESTGAISVMKTQYYRIYLCFIAIVITVFLAIQPLAKKH